CTHASHPVFAPLDPQFHSQAFLVSQMLLLRPGPSILDGAIQLESVASHILRLKEPRAIVCFCQPSTLLQSEKPQYLFPITVDKPSAYRQAFGLCRLLAIPQFSLR